ncbi:MAG: hypothetical protein RIE56_04450, partial [Amphiplicatus sp.]
EYEEATALAQKAANRGLSLSFAGHPGFQTLTAQPGFAAVADKMAANLSPIGEATVWRAHDDAALLPEAVAFNPSRKQAFVGSARSGKILRFDDGAARPEGFAFAPGGVYAITISNNALWAAANTGSPFENAAPGTSLAGVYAYKLNDGALISEHVLESGDSVFGALEATPAGLIVSDSGAPQLFVLRKGEKALEVFSEDPRYVNLQGLAYDESRKTLFVSDYLAGLFAVDLKTGAATLLANEADAHLGGIDGLYAYKGALIGIQNGTSPQRIIRLRLNAEGDAVERLDVLQQNLPEWNEPTNGAIIGDVLIYVATSNWPAYGDDGAEIDGARREPLRLMSVGLD